MTGTPRASQASGGTGLVSGVAFLWGLQSAFFGPTLTVILVALFHASAGQVGTVLMAYNAVAFVAAAIIPAWADRHRSYVPLTVVAAALYVLLVTGLALSPSLGWAAAALMVFGAPAGVGFTLLFAQMRHAGSTARELMNTRAMVSASWVGGPPIATLVLATWGDRGLLWTIAAIGVVTVVATLTWARTQRRPEDAADAPDPVVLDRLHLPRVGIAALAVAFVLLAAANSSATSVMVLFVTHRLHLSVMWGGVTLAVAAALEVPVMMVLGRLSARVPMLRLVVTGGLVGVVFYGGMLLVHAVPLLLALQLANAWFTSVLVGLGLTLFQQVIPRPGLASGMFANTRMLGNVLAGPIIGLAAWSSLGYGVVFAAAAVLASVATVVIAMIGRAVRPTADAWPSGGRDSREVAARSSPRCGATR